MLIAFQMFILFLGLQEEPQKLLIRKWELKEVVMGKNKMIMQAVPNRRAVVYMEFFENGKCVITSQPAQSPPKENKWSVLQEESNWILHIEAENEFGGKVKQKFKIEKITKKELILSLGEKDDKETYFYKAIK
ncbi:hypothetical protein [Raineya orbicola]|uniref:Lipocalin-like domain-containing protein n=1 Tax=Raineya orbicola TaxID=2016530 RepID=A0A2N3IDD5_9BACT|nr:hypothetical protein [Raineya orbicola]PKQ68288.1 hypothetical protein Rain11_1756 [Raineya orbicola]